MPPTDAGPPDVVDVPGAEPAAAGRGRLGHRRAGGRLGGQPDQVPAPYRPDLLQAEFDELTAQAEELVAEATGLHSAHGPARAQVTDRAGWVSANVRQLPAAARPAPRPARPARLARANAAAARLAGPLASAGAAATGAQMGLVLGWLSTRVLGQYDLLLTEEAAEDQDLVYFVGPNIVALEQQHGFDPSEFRLWLALARGDPPLPVHRRALDARLLRRAWSSEVLGSPRARPGRLRRVAPADGRPRSGPGATRCEDNGALGLLATPEQLEGLSTDPGDDEPARGPRRRDHGPGRRGRASRAPPASPRCCASGASRPAGLARLLQQLIGLEAKMRQYEEGERFIERSRGGRAGAARPGLGGPEWLPTLEEIRDPATWVARVGATPRPWPR